MQKISHGLDTVAGGQCLPSFSTLFIGGINNEGAVLNWSVDDDGRPSLSIESWIPVTLVQRKRK